MTALEYNPGQEKRTLWSSSGAWNKNMSNTCRMTAYRFLCVTIAEGTLNLKKVVIAVLGNLDSIK